MQASIVQKQTRSKVALFSFFSHMAEGLVSGEFYDLLPLFLVNIFLGINPCAVYTSH